MACIIINTWMRALLAAIMISACLSAVAETPSGTDSTKLEEIIVEENALAETELPLGTAVLGETLKDTTGSSGDPFRGLQALPGFVYVDDESADPAVRGARPGDNHFEVDFIPVKYLSHADNAVSVFNSDLVESFSIYSSAYGPEFSGVSGGVFDVRLRDPAIDKLHATLDINFLHSGLLLEGPINATQSFYLAGRVSYLDVFVQDQLNDDTNYKQFPKYTDYQSKYVWDVSEKSTLRFQAVGASDDFEAVVPSENNSVNLADGTILRDFESTSFHQQGLIIDSKLSDSILSKSVFAFTESNDTEQNGGNVLFDQVDSQSLLKSSLEVSLGDDHLLSLGASFRRDELRSIISFDKPDCSEQSPDCDTELTTRASTKEVSSTDHIHFFMKNSWFATDKLTIFPGFVYLSENRLGNQFLEPRVALEFSATEDLILSAAIGLYNQDAEPFQLSQLYGNPDLEYIQSEDLIVGAQMSLANGWNIKTEFYYKKLSNLVRRDDTLVYNNNGEGRAYGLDTLIRKTLGEKLTGWLSISLSEATRRNSSNDETHPFSYDQPYNISLVGKYELSRDWNIGAKIWLHSGAPYTPVTGATPGPDGSDGFIPQFGEFNSARYPSYKRVDLRLNRKFKHRQQRNTVVSVEVLNLFDHENVSYYRYNSDFTQSFAVHQLPRIVGLGITTHF